MASSQPLLSSPNPDSDIPVSHALQADSSTESRAESGYQASSNLPLYSRLLGVAYTYAGRIYLAGFLSLPSRYFLRVDRVLKEIDLAVKETASMHVAKAEETKDTENAIASETAENDEESGVHDNSNPLELSSSYPQLTKECNDMIDSLVVRWDDSNFASIMLLLATLIWFPDANDPVTRSLGLWSIILALLSLSYGCLCARQFGRLRDERVMIQWALKREEHEGTFWNTWVMLSLPIASLYWTDLVHLCFIICFCWRSLAGPPPEPSFLTAPSMELGLRIVTYTLVGVGTGYLFLAITHFIRLNDLPSPDRWKHQMNTKMAEAIASAQEKPQLSPGP